MKRTETVTGADTGGGMQGMHPPHQAERGGDMTLNSIETYHRRIQDFFRGGAQGRAHTDVY